MLLTELIKLPVPMMDNSVWYSWLLDPQYEIQSMLWAIPNCEERVLMKTSFIID